MSLPNHISEVPYWKLWRAKNREHWNAYQRQYRKNNPEKYCIYRKRRLENRLEHVLELRRKSYARRKQKVLAKNKEYFLINRTRIFRQRNKRERIRKAEDPAFRCERLLRNRIVEVIKYQRAIKSIRTKELIGCDRECLMRWIESQFTEGMTWENHGVKGWHIDHIRPCASFDLSDPDQQKQCFNYRNLQPLWAKDNQTKSDKITV